MTRIFTGLAILAALSFADDRTGTEDAIDSYLDEAGTEQYLAQADDEAAKERWVGKVGLGFTYTDGTTKVLTLAYNAEAKREWDKWIVNLVLTGIFSETDNVESANEHILFGRGDYKLDDKSSIYASLMLEHDSQENISLRIRLVVGYSRKLVKKDNFELSGDIGVGILNEDFMGIIPTKTEAIAVIAVRWKWQITKTVLYEQIISLDPSLSNGGEWRLTWISNFSMPVAKNLKFVLNIRDTYNTQPAPGTTHNQLVVAILLSYDF